MNTSVNKVVAGKPIEKMLKNNVLLPTSNGFINESMARLRDLRQQYIQAPQVGKNVLKLPTLKK